MLALDGILEPVRAERIEPGARDLVLVGRVLSQRVARAVAGGTLLVATFILIAFTGLQSFTPGHKFMPQLLRFEVFDVGVPTIAIVLLAVTLAAYLGGLRAGDRMFARRLREADPLTALRTAVKAFDGWAVSLGIAGLTAAATLIGSMYFSLGERPWVIAMLEDLFVVTDRLRDVTVAIGFVITSALIVGRACVRGAGWIAILEPWWVFAAGLVVGAVTLYLGFVFDIGPIHVTFEFGELPSEGLRHGLTVGGVVALVLTTTCFTLRRRRREQSRCGLE